MPFRLEAAHQTDIGKQREHNEDTTFVSVTALEDGDDGLFLVADGMGGHQAGEIASQLAVEVIAHLLGQTREIPLPPRRGEHRTTLLWETLTLIEEEQRLRGAIEQAHQAIVSYGEKMSSMRVPGSTVTVISLRRELACIANVGDSRAYLLRNGHLVALTQDHSLVARLLSLKLIRPSDVATHPSRNIIYRALGAGHSHVALDFFFERLLPGDRLLLCSDGLWQMVGSDDLLHLMSLEEPPQRICERLIEQANANGGKDNIAVVIVIVEKT